MKVYKAAIIGLGPSGLAVNKILYGDSFNEIIAFESEDINKRDNIFGFWLHLLATRWIVVVGRESKKQCDSRSKTKMCPAWPHGPLLSRQWWIFVNCCRSVVKFCRFLVVSGEVF